MVLKYINVNISKDCMVPTVNFFTRLYITVNAKRQSLLKGSKTDLNAYPNVVPVGAMVPTSTFSGTHQVLPGSGWDQIGLLPSKDSSWLCRFFYSQALFSLLVGYLDRLRNIHSYIGMHQGIGNRSVKSIEKTVKAVLSAKKRKEEKAEQEVSCQHSG